MAYQDSDLATTIQAGGVASDIQDGGGATDAQDGGLGLVGTGGFSNGFSSGFEVNTGNLLGGGLAASLQGGGTRLDAVIGGFSNGFSNGFEIIPGYFYGGCMTVDAASGDVDSDRQGSKASVSRQG